MKEIILIGLLVASTLGTAHPYFPYEDDEDSTHYVHLCEKIINRDSLSPDPKENNQKLHINFIILTAFPAKLTQGKKSTDDNENNVNGI